MTYETGYRRPPVDKQFKKGTSGNPKGRPKGSRNMLKVLKDELNAKVTVTQHGKKKRITCQEAMVKKLVGGALNGDPKAFILLMNVMRQLGLLGQSEPENLLPADYEAVVAGYLEAHKNSHP